jgi:hypothetical protein
MRKSDMIKTLVIALIAIGSAGAAAVPDGEAALAKATQGRVAGKPANCLSLRKARSSRVIRGTAIIFEGGGTLYVNRPISGAESLSESNALMLSTLTGEICRGEAIRLFDNTSRVETGAVFIGQFIPYRKADVEYRPQTEGYRSY